MKLNLLRRSFAVKKPICSILIVIFLFSLVISLVSCDIGYFCSLDVLCSNENASIIEKKKKVNSFNFSGVQLNRPPLQNYSTMDFTSKESDGFGANIYRFEVSGSDKDTYNLSLKLVEANRYVVDFLRVGIIIDGELRVYKYYDKHETIYHKENDPDTLLHFHSKRVIFNDLNVDFSADETKEIVIFVWIEEAELYDKNGESYTGWKDKSYKTSSISLSLEIGE